MSDSQKQIDCDVEITELKLPKYVLYDTETNKILCASNMLDTIESYLGHVKMDHVSDKLMTQLDRLAEAKKEIAEEEDNVSAKEIP